MNEHSIWVGRSTTKPRALKRRTIDAAGLDFFLVITNEAHNNDNLQEEDDVEQVMRKGVRLFKVAGCDDECRKLSKIIDFVHRKASANISFSGQEERLQRQCTSWLFMLMWRGKNGSNHLDIAQLHDQIFHHFVRFY